MKAMNRRDFAYSLAASAALAASRGLAQPVAENPSEATLEVGSASVDAVMPMDFTGLSYESAQLANPPFFSATNEQLIKIFRELTPNGVLRLGGGSSNFTTYSATSPAGPPPFEVFGPDTSKTIKTGTITSALSLSNLRAFLDATNWRCIYGLNLGQGTKENAVRESAAVFQILGPRLIALQIGNEPDSFRNRYRPASYTPLDFMKEWNDFHHSILAVTPRAQFAGPDISNKLAFFIAFAAEASQHPDVILLTAHSYAMGPAGSPKATLDRLLVDDPSVQTQPESQLDAILAEARSIHLPYRMCEGNSCWNGGEPGISDTLASALWCGDYMLHLAQKGVVGVNMHGGGNGYYTPIAGIPSIGIKPRPEYFGMQVAQMFAEATFLSSTLRTRNPRLTTYVARRGSVLLLAVFNKSIDAALITLPQFLSRSAQHAEVCALTGAAFDSKEVTFTGAKPVAAPVGRVTVPGKTAVVYRFDAYKKP